MHRTFKIVCPTCGIEFDEKTGNIIDSGIVGKIKYRRCRNCASTPLSDKEIEKLYGEELEDEDPF